MRQLFIVLLISIVGLVGCGGGDDSSTPQATPLSIDLKGDVKTVIPFNALWEEPGVTVSGDNADAAKITIDGDVDTYTPGEYEIVYTATTPDGVTTSITRVVTVNPQRFTLTVSSFGTGTIKVTGSNIDERCNTGGTCRFLVDDGATVTLTAENSENSEFKGWDFCDAEAGVECTKTVDTNVLVSATFLSTAPFEAKSNIVTLSDEQIRAIQGYSADSDIIEFKPDTDLTGVNVGNVIISKGVFVDTDDPDNVDIYFARRVREVIELSGATVIVKTVKVSLDDIFDSGALSTIEPEAQGKSHNQNKVTYSLPVDVEVNQNLTVQGQVSFSVDPTYDIEFESFGRVKSARTLMRLTQNGQLTIQIKDAIETPNKKLKLGSKKITPIVIPTPVGIPVVLVPEVTFYIVPKAMAEAALNPSITLSNTIIAGAHYNSNHGWTNLGEFSQSTTGNIGQVKGRIAAEAVVIAEIATEVYDLAGPLLSAGPGAGVEAVVAVPPTDDCAFEYGFYFKVGANVGGKFSAFGKELKYQAKVIDKSFPVGGVRCIKDSESPTTPTSVNATAVSDESIEVSWEAAEDNVRVAHYEIWRRSTLLQIATRIQDKWVGTQFTDTSLNNNEEYCYFLYAVDGKGNISEEPSPYACATTQALDETAPTPPKNLIAEALSTSAISLSWQASLDDVGVESYIVYEQVGDRYYALSQTESDTMQYNVGGLIADTEYCFVVSAIDEAGNESEKSANECINTSAPEFAKWKMLLACQGLEQNIRESIDLDENVGSRVDVAGVGNDYDGTGLSYILNGVYSSQSGELSARIVWRFEGSTKRRVDRFTADLSSGNTGRVPMTQVEETGCDGDVQFIREDVANKFSSPESQESEQSNVKFGPQ